MAAHNFKGKRVMREDLEMNEKDVPSLTAKHERLLRGTPWSKRKSIPWLTDEEFTEHYDDIYLQYDPYSKNEPQKDDPKIMQNYLEGSVSEYTLSAKSDTIVTTSLESLVSTYETEPVINEILDEQDTDPSERRDTSEIASEQEENESFPIRLFVDKGNDPIKIIAIKCQSEDSVFQHPENKKYFENMIKNLPISVTGMCMFSQLEHLKCFENDVNSKTVYDKKLSNEIKTNNVFQENCTCHANEVGARKSKVHCKDLVDLSTSRMVSHLEEGLPCCFKTLKEKNKNPCQDVRKRVRCAPPESGENDDICQKLKYENRRKSLKGIIKRSSGQLCTMSPSRSDDFGHDDNNNDEIHKKTSKAINQDSYSYISSGSLPEDSKQSNSITRGSHSPQQLGVESTYRRGQMSSSQSMSFCMFSVTYVDMLKMGLVLLLFTSISILYFGLTKYCC